MTRSCGVSMTQQEVTQQSVHTCVRDIFGSKVKKKCHVLNLVLNVICLYSISFVHLYFISVISVELCESNLKISVNFLYNADPIYIQIKFKNKQN